MSYIYLFVSQIMIGGVGAAARYADLSADWITVLRSAVAAAFLLTVLLVSRAVTRDMLRGKALPLFLTGAFMGLNWMFFFKAVLTTDLSIAIIAYNATPLFVAISAAIFLKERPAAGQSLALAIILMATVTVLVFGFVSESLPGVIYAVIASAFYAQVTVVGRYLKDIPALLVAASQGVVGGLVILSFAFIGGPVPAFSVGTIGIVVLIGIGMTAVPYLMYFHALKSVNSIAASLAHSVYTLTTFAFGVFWFEEQVPAFIVMMAVLLGLTPLISYVVRSRSPALAAESR